MWTSPGKISHTSLIRTVLTNINKHKLWIHRVTNVSCHLTHRGCHLSMSHVHKKQNISLNSSQSSSLDPVDPAFSAGFTTGQGLLSKSLQSKIASLTRNKDPAPGVVGPFGSLDAPMFRNASTPITQYPPPPHPSYPGYSGHAGVDGHPAGGVLPNAPPGISDTDVHENCHGR